MLNEDVSLLKIDPKLNTNINDLIDFKPNAIFICVPTPMNEDFSQDISILKDVIKRINYNYYRNGIDLMTINKDVALVNIKKAFEMFLDINRYRPNSILKEIFFISKNDEIFNIFKNDSELVDIDEIKLILKNISPFHSNKWNKL